MGTGMLRELLDRTLRLAENDGNHEYSVVKVEAPKEVAEKAIELSLSIPDDQIYEDPGDTSFGRELEVHITVKYGLETWDPIDVQKALGSSQIEDLLPIVVKLGKTDIFESDKPYDVVYVSVQSAQLRRFHELLNSLPNGDEHPNYVPHICIAYVKKGEGAQYVGRADFDGVEFSTSTLVFKTPSGDSTKIDLQQ